MTNVPEAVLTELGRLVVNIAELESALSLFPGLWEDANTRSVLGRPGEALRSARRIVAAMSQDEQDFYEPLVEQAADLLHRRHAVIHAIWGMEYRDDEPPILHVLHARTFEEVPVSIDYLRTFASEVQACRNDLVRLVTLAINRKPLSRRDAED